MNAQVDVLVPGIKQRRYAFHKGKDHVTVWMKPKRPQWMSIDDYKRYPKSISIREFKTNGVVYMSTLLQTKTYPKHELKQLYKRRWDIEIHLNSLKTTMGMDTLSCKTPSMIRKEISIHLLAYNIIRHLMKQASIQHRKCPWQLSFKTAIQLFQEFFSSLFSTRKHKQAHHKMLRLIATKTVGNRPGRVEPRLLKQRRQKFPNLKMPRCIEQQNLRALAHQRKGSLGLEKYLLEA